MNLGLPYKGSKNTIAEDLVKCLPRGKKLLDACCGGGAVLMAAAMSNRWEKVVGNDLNPARLEPNLQNFCKKLAKKLKNGVFMRKILTKPYKMYDFPHFFAM